ncbi:hypothetical protein BVRB_005180 [Beta vulgaris subsp. vulgaris]|uniref:Uncharacterized protein n=1 Tax=Beta vulgaris subsp. vulgaris TaxID=3555 RepID=A0A0J8B3P5_BETVV|nr:hypothetical protein BVRB_005180 [Beta vulgaris subsp. vulgaris]
MLFSRSWPLPPGRFGVRRLASKNDGRMTLSGLLTDLSLLFSGRGFGWRPYGGRQIVQPNLG